MPLTYPIPPINIVYGALYSAGSSVTNGGSQASSVGTGHVPGDIITLAGGAFTRAAEIGVTSVLAVSATVAAGGSGGTNGAVTVTGTTGTGTKFQFSGTISGGALTGPLTLVTAGNYTVKPTTITAEPVTGGNLTGATVSVVLGVCDYQIIDPGKYSYPPANPVAQGSTTGSGIGAAFAMSWGPVASTVEGSSLRQGGGNFFIGGNLNSGATNPGELAGGQNSGNENVYVGCRAGGLATTGNANTAVGHNAMGIGAAVSVTAGAVTAIGNDCMRNIGATASNNTGVGASALRNVTGLGNTAVGLQALTTATSANDNTAVGQNAGQKITGSNNVFIGSKAASSASGAGAASNTIIGYQGGLTLTTGGSNVIVGANVGSTTLATGSSNILIGTSSAVDTPASNTSNYLNVGALLYGDLSNKYLGVGISTLVAAWMGIAAGTTAKAQFNFASSTAPTSPNDGDFWFDGTNFKARVGGATKTFTIA